MATDVDLAATVLEQGLLVKDVAESGDDYEKRLKKLVNKLKASQKDYATAIKLFDKVNKCDGEVLQFLADFHPEASILTKETTLLEAAQLLVAREQPLKFVVPLSRIGMKGHIEVSKLLGRFSFNRLFRTSLKILKK